MSSGGLRILGNEGHGTAPAAGAAPRISSLLIKPASAVCNLDCTYCFYLDREADPYAALPHRQMTEETLERLVDTYLFYSFPNSVFAFQGGEPTLAGLPFFEKLVGFQKRFGRAGQSVSNSLQTNGILLDENWCKLFREYNWLIGISMDGPEKIHDSYRLNKGGQGTWRRVMQSIETMQKEKVEFNVLCVVSQANVDRPRELYKFFRSIGADNIQYIPLSEFDSGGSPMPFTPTPEQYGRFLVESFDAWWPDRRNVRIRFFDNLAEALAGQTPGTCTLHQTCGSYVVVEYNGDIYPCDFFVDPAWNIGNVNLDSWTEIARRQKRSNFNSKKTIATPECAVCEWQNICHNGCPKFRHAAHKDFEQLDYFCAAYKMIYAKAVGPLRRDLARLRR